MPDKKPGMPKISLCGVGGQHELILSTVEKVTRGLNNRGKIGQKVKLEAHESTAAARE